MTKGASHPQRGLTHAHLSSWAARSGNRNTEQDATGVEFTSAPQPRALLTSKDVDLKQKTHVSSVSIIFRNHFHFHFNLLQIQNLLVIEKVCVTNPEVAAK